MVRQEIHCNASALADLKISLRTLAPPLVMSSGAFFVGWSRRHVLMERVVSLVLAILAQIDKIMGEKFGTW